MSLKSLAALAAICSVAAMEAAEAPKMPPVTVSVDKAVAVESGYAKKYAGEISSFKDVGVVPRITGVFQKKHFKEGDVVQEGDLLFEFEDVTYRAKVDSARAAVDKLKAQLRYQTLSYDRAKTLRGSKAVSQSALDEAEEQLSTVKAQLFGAEADLRDAENTLSYTKVYAPFTGRTGKVRLSAGNLVTPSTGTLVTISMVAPVYVTFSIGEKVFRSEFGGREGFPKNAVIKVELADGSLYPEEAAVTIIDSKIDTVTNTIKIWGTFQNKDMQLIPGSYVTVRLRSRLNSNLTGVRPSALQVDDKGTFVYVVNASGAPERRAVATGDVSGDCLEIRKGLAPGETVIVEGMQKLRPGVGIVPVPLKADK